MSQKDAQKINVRALLRESDAIKTGTHAPLRRPGMLDELGRITGVTAFKDWKARLEERIEPLMHPITFYYAVAVLLFLISIIATSIFGTLLILIPSAKSSEGLLLMPFFWTISALLVFIVVKANAVWRNGSKRKIASEKLLATFGTTLTSMIIVIPIWTFLVYTFMRTAAAYAGWSLPVGLVVASFCVSSFASIKVVAKVRQNLLPPRARRLGCGSHPPTEIIKFD